MMRRTAVVVLAAAMLVIGAAGALALSPPGTHDEGPYFACVNSRTGTVRMVEQPVAGTPLCRATEYSMAWGFPFEMEYGYDTAEEVVDATYASHFIACPDGQLPMGGGGSFSPDPESSPMFIETSMGIADENSGPPYGWQVEFSSPDGLPRSGTVYGWVVCTFANIRGWGD